MDRQSRGSKRLDWIKVNMAGKTALVIECLDLLLAKRGLDDVEAVEVLCQALTELAYEPPPVLKRPDPK